MLHLGQLIRFLHELCLPATAVGFRLLNAGPSEKAARGARGLGWDWFFPFLVVAKISLP
jgi:hypothetical protein